MKYLPGQNSGILIPYEVIGEAVNLTFQMNEFLEDRVLVPHERLGFKEYPGFVRRGIMKYSKSSFEALKEPISADPFERQLWPGVDNKNIFLWAITYEKAPNYDSTGNVLFGRMIYPETDMSSHQDIEKLAQITKAPFFVGGCYDAALKNERVFSSVNDIFGFLEKYVVSLPYQKRT